MTWGDPAGGSGPGAGRPATDGPVAGGLDPLLADRLSAAKLWLVATSSPTTCGNLPYLASAVFALVPIPTGRVRTMSVDGRWRLYLNPPWVAGTDIPVLAGTIAHLVWHLLADHAGRAADVGVGTTTAARWAAAADATVAELLGSAEVPTGLRGPAALGLPPGRSAEEYHERLRRPGAAEATAGAGAAEAGWDGCGSGCDGLPRPYDLPPVDGAGGIGPHDAADLRRRVAIEFREHQTGIGTRPGEWSRWVAGILDPVVPWPQVLAAAVRRGLGWVHGHTDYTYSRVSRRQSSVGRVILPATRRPVPEVAVVVDTSGSVDDGLLAQALGEVDGVLAGLGVAGRSVHVLATDAAVHAVSRVQSARDVRLGGGGGTDMGVGVAAAVALRPRPSVVVVLTDGWTPWPPTPPPVPVVAAVVGRAAGELPPTPDWVRRVEVVPR